MRVECLAAGLRGHETGIWGGSTGRSRKRLKVSVAEADWRLSELVDARSAGGSVRERGLPDVRRNAIALKAEDPNLTHQAIADRCGVSRVAVTRWLHRQDVA